MQLTKSQLFKELFGEKPKENPNSHMDNVLKGKPWDEQARLILANRPR